MNYPKRFEKPLQEALKVFCKGKSDVEATVDDIYRLLDSNLQRKLRKQQIQTFLNRNPMAPEINQSSQNSSTSDDNDSESKKKSKKNGSVSSSPDGKGEQELRERSGRTIKRKQVFDPSDYTKAKKLEKPTKDAFCKICGKGFEPTPDLTPQKKTSCVGCKKRRAHRACFSEPMPWRCDDCRLCAICDGNSPEVSPLVACLKCRESVHQQCGNINDPDNWTCSRCKSSPDAKKENHEVVKPKIKATRRSSLKKEQKIQSGLNNHDDEIPDCSRWTPHQVYSYLIIYVPSEDAKAFLDQEIDGRSLKLMRRSDVIANFHLKLGSAVKVYAQVKRLQDRSNNIKLCWP